MKTLTKGLFGGVLIGAGLCSSAVADVVPPPPTAGTPEFNWLNTAQAGAFAPFGMWNTHSGDGNFDVSDTFGIGFAQSMADQSGISLESRSDLAGSFAFRGGNPNTAVAYVDTQFYMTEDTSVTITWDFRDMSGSFLEVAGFIAMGASGSVQLDLLANVLYDMDAQVTDMGSLLDPFINDGSSITMTVNVVPLPTAAFAGLGMLAGLGAYRRIRK